MTYNIGCDVYPGAYVPMLNEKEIDKYIHEPHKNELVFPVINMTELNDSFKIEVMIPGVRREDFFIHADDNILTVCVIHKDKELSMSNEQIGFRIADYECLDRHITLPKNVDPEFISAEYKDGTLCMFAHKIKRPNRPLHSTIVVY
ncbi:hypothetical protein BH10BAC3_BH10BAC3_05690 [soil metagenome]